MKNNPFSTLLFFDKKRFANYWFRTDTPTFLIDLLKNGNQMEPVLKPIVADERLLRLPGGRIATADD